jgi:outer membrane protein assembly complex protein YaeT
MLDVFRFGLATLLFSPLAFAQDDTLTRALAGADLLAGTLADKSRDKVRFQGNQTLPEDQLRTAISGQIQEIVTQGITPPRADDAAYYLGAHYRKSGFSRVEVTFRIDGGKLTLIVNEGPRSLLRGITFIGNTKYPTAQLYEYMIGATPERLAKEPEQFPFNASAVAGGAERVRNFYVTEGYLDATVDASQIAMSANDTRASVTVRIVEGRRYTFGDLRIIDPRKAYPSERLRVALGEDPQGPFSTGKVVSMQRNLQSFYKGRGYFQATVAAEADPKKSTSGHVPVTFTVASGSLFRFGQTHVTNEKGRLKKDFLPRRFEHLQGKVYDPEKLDETFREMLRTGLFTNLRVNAVPKPGDFVDLDLIVEEAPAKEVGFTLGFGTYDGATVGLRLGDRNLFGNGRPLTFSADWSQRGILGELLYVDPWLFDTRFSLRSRLYSVIRDEEGYSKSSFGLRFDLGRRLAPNLEVAAFLQEEKVSIDEITIPLDQVGLTSYLLTDVGLTLAYDLRDNAISPTRGFVIGSSIDFGLLDSEPAFTRGTLRFSYYLPLGKKCLLALGARGGLISPIVDQIPIDVRFFNGGANSVRSFAERDLGPKDKAGNPLGGEFYTVFNAELTFPLWKALQGAVFVDAGNLTDFDNAGLNDMRYGVGAGLRYKLPVGPLRLDYGVNPSPRADEERGAFHFSFGFAF